MSATVVLPVRNGAATLDLQLAALAAQDHATPWELVVVDNGSRDATLAVVDGWKAKIPHLRIVSEPRRGSNRARNAGVGAARGPVVLFCDADDEVSAGWVRHMVNALARFDVVGGALEVDRLNGASPMRALSVQRDGLPVLLDRPYAVGANLGMTRAVFDAIHAFDVSFGIGCDEVEACIRAQLAGCSIGFAADAVVHYRVRDTTRDVFRQRFAYGLGRQRLVGKASRHGWFATTRAGRWRSLASQATRLVQRPSLLRRRAARLIYVADVAYLVGQVAGLSLETLSGGWWGSRRNP